MSAPALENRIACACNQYYSRKHLRYSHIKVSCRLFIRSSLSCECRLFKYNISSEIASGLSRKIMMLQSLDSKLKKLIQVKTILDTFRL